MKNVLTRFDGGTEDLQWRVVNDNVMGGQSQGELEIVGGLLVFRGATNTNGGGFSSIRSDPAPIMVPESAGGIELRVRGDGRNYIFRVETQEGIAYWADFATTKDWRVAKVAFGDFRPRRRGQWLAGPVLDPARIDQLGLMVYDGLDGKFRLEVDWIGFAAPEPTN